MTSPAASRGPFEALRAFAAAPYVLLPFGMLFWAGNAVVGRAVVGVVPPLQLSFLRWAIAALVLAPIVARHLRADWPAIRANWPMVALLALFSVVAYNTLLYLALTWTTAINASIVGATGPVVIPLAAYVMMRAPLGALKAFGIAVSFVGMLAVIVRGDPGAVLALAFNQGDLLLILAVVAWAVYSVLLRRQMAKTHPLSLLFAMIVCGLAITAPFSAGEWLMGARIRWSPASAAAILYTGIFPSLLSFHFWNRGIAALGPTAASQYLYLVPIFAAVLAIVFLGETLQWFHVVGAGLVFAGIRIATVAPAPPPRPAGERAP